MDRLSALNQIDRSVLPEALKYDIVEALRDGVVMLGQDAIEKEAVPSTITAGSFDPPTFGHHYLIEQTQRIDPNAGIVVVASTSKDPNYQLFSPIERAALIRSYGVRMPIILGEHTDPEEHKRVLKELHQGAKTIVKGRRGPLDSEHTAKLGPKYGIPTDHFLEIQSPDSLISVSSGDLKGMVWDEVVRRGQLATADRTRKFVSDVVYDCVKKAIEARNPVRNHIFRRRLEAGSSEALFG